MFDAAYGLLRVCAMTSTRGLWRAAGAMLCAGCAPVIDGVGRASDCRVEANGEARYDLQTAAVSVRLTHFGQPLADSAAAQLLVAFVDRQRAHRVERPVARDGVETRLLTGEYEVWILPAGGCDAAPLCVPAKLADRFVVGTGRNEAAFDLRPFTMTLSLRLLDGSGVVFDGDQQLTLACGSGPAMFEQRFAMRYGASISLRALSGDCRARWAQVRANDREPCGSGWACGTYAWPQPVQLRPDANVALTLPTARVFGTINVDAMPAQSASGVLWFVSERDGTRVLASSLSASAMRYDVRLPHGSYRVQWENASTDPPTAYTLRTGLVLDADTPLDEVGRDVRFRVTRVLGAPGTPSLPIETRLALRSLDVGSDEPIWLDRGARVRPGAYALDAHAGDPLSSRPSASLRVAGTVIDRIEIRSDTALEVAVAPVAVEVDLLVDGALVEPRRARVRFVKVDGGAAFVFDASLDAAAWLTPGRYHIEADDRVTGAAPLFTTRQRVASDVEIVSATRLRLDLRSRRLHGRVTLDGRPLFSARCETLLGALREGDDLSSWWPIAIDAEGRFDLRTADRTRALFLWAPYEPCRESPDTPQALAPLLLPLCGADP